MKTIIKRNQLSITRISGIKHRAYLKLLTLICFLLIGLNSSAQFAMLRLQVFGPNNTSDETILYYEPGTTMSFDNDYDIKKPGKSNPQVSIAQVYDNNSFQVNAVSPVKKFMPIPVLVKSPVSGPYKILATDFDGLPYGTCIILKDRHTGNITDLKTGNYIFALSDTTKTPQFDLEISYMNLPITTSIIPAASDSLIDNFVVKGIGPGPWNYIWKDASGLHLKTNFSYEADSLNPLHSGEYQVFVESTNGCGYNTSGFTINPVVSPNRVKQKELNFPFPTTSNNSTFINRLPRTDAY